METMLYEGDILSATLTQKEFAALVGLSPARINQLVQSDVLVRDAKSRDGRLMLFASMKKFYEREDQTLYWRERALHERAKRQLAELAVARRESELYEASEVKGFLAEMIRSARAEFESLGKTLAPALIGKSAAQICVKIDEEIRARLTALSKQGDETDERKV